MLIHTGLSSASTLGFPLGSLSSLPFQLWILQLSTWMPCSDLLANYPWNICFLAHTREKRYWPVCSWPLQACPLALCFCPYPRTFLCLLCQPLATPLTRKKSQQSKEWVSLDYLSTCSKRRGRKEGFEDWSLIQILSRREGWVLESLSNVPW